MAPTSSTVPPTRSACVPKTLRPDLKNEYRCPLLSKRQQVAKRRTVILPDPDGTPVRECALEPATIVLPLVVWIAEVPSHRRSPHQHAARSQEFYQLPHECSVIADVLQHFVAVHQIKLARTRGYR